MKTNKPVSQMTVREVEDFFEKMQHIVHAAYPEDKAEQLMSDMSEAFFKTYSLEANKSCSFIELRVGQNVKLKNHGDYSYHVIDIDLAHRKVFLQPSTSRCVAWYDISEVVV